MEKTCRKAEEKGKKSILPDESHCACCLQPFLTDCGEECGDCGAKSCRKSCTRWDQSDETWRCIFCSERRCSQAKKDKCPDLSDSALGELDHPSSTGKFRIQDEGAENGSINRSVDLAAGGSIEGTSMETIRGLLVEKIVEGLVSNVDDDTPTDRLYVRWYKPASNSQSMAQTTLRDLVERVVDEARKLPGLGTSEPAKKQHEQHFSEQSYGDLLTTAIVNKVIEKYQDESLDGNSNVLNGKSLHGQTDEDFGHEGEQGYESSQPLSHNEHSSEYGAVPSKRPRNRRSPLSLTIEERIEEVTTYTSDEEYPLNLENRLDFRNARRVPFPEFGIDIIDPFRESSDESHDEPESPTNVDIVTPMESWEENWLFQKKKIHTRSEPVSMLVPNPSADFRALIGDTDADDTSDLSECSVHSDDEVETELTLAISKVVPNLIDSDLEILDVDITDKLLPNTSKKEKTELPKIVKSEGNETEIDEKFEMLLKSNAIELEMPLEPRANNSVVAEWNKLVSESEKDILEKSCTAGMTKMLQNEEENKKLKNLTLELETPMIKSSKSVDNSILELPKTPASTPVANSSEDNNKMMITDLQTLQEKLDSFGEENKESDQKEEQSYTETSALQNDIYTAKPYFENGTDVPELNGFQQESEYTVHDVIATQRHIAGASKGLRISIGSDVTDNPVPEISLPVASSPPPSESSGKCREAAASVQKSDDPLFTPPRPGTIAEREHKKWENAAPIENNPYSEENIQKRLMERQYTRRSADLSGNNSELPKISDNVQILFGGHKPDVRRFGRDYYVNEAKTPSYEKTRRSTTTSSSSRPTSSLSQHSNSTCSDVEPQEQLRSTGSESDGPANPHKKFVKTKVSQWQQNNIDSSHAQSPKRIEEISMESLSLDEKRAKDNTAVNEFLECERKNSKNELNAKLNNLDTSDVPTILEGIKPYVEDRQKQIRRIDLKAYGFENELEQRHFPAKAQRVVNKLDLKSFGYEGLRRTQSINQLDDRVRKSENLEPRARKPRSNFTQTQPMEKFENYNFENSQAAGDFAMCKSTENLDECILQNGDKYSSPHRGMKSATSVPNIMNAEHYYNSTFYGENVNISPESILREKIVQEGERSPFDNGGGGDSLLNRNGFDGSSGDVSLEESTHLPDIALPSVKQLREAFSKKSEESRNLSPRVLKMPLNKWGKKRSSTPEIHIVETPRQMHSLTARSLSKEFREGLRQSPNKSNSKIKTDSLPFEMTELSDANNKDIDVISPGKLRNNIAFWEQLQRRS